MTANIITHAIGNTLLAEFNWVGISQHKNAITNYCLIQEKPNTIESNVAIRAKNNLWESRFNFLETTDINIIALKLWIIASCEEYINTLNQSCYKFIITESWAHVTRQHGYHLPHYHSNSTWSGIVYISGDFQAGGKNTWLVPYNLERKLGLEFINDSYTITPKSGRMMLFPSMLTHYAEPYLGETPRIVIAFNGICIK